MSAVLPWAGIIIRFYFTARGVKRRLQGVEDQEQYEERGR
jgi:hypothetical protein